MALPHDRALKISVATRHATVRFAARELARYLRRATGKPVRVVSGKSEAQLKLGVCHDIGVKRPAKLADGDDWICIKPSPAGYLITGANARSVLFAAYRYLHELGFRWIRPGTRGQIIPNLKNPNPKGITVNDTPTYRYRTICIEGACSRQHVIDLIDWSAKHGMNGYFIQFDLGSCFFENWYRHKDNPYMRAESVGRGRIEAIVADVVREIGKRNLRFERVGHGWTCAAVGVGGEGWQSGKTKLPPGKRQWLAQIGGQRDWFGGVPLNTNLCYSNPDVQHAMTEAIVGYAKAHPEVDLLHFWLADGSNNSCECADCRKHRPADLYIDMANLLDRKLTDAGLATKIVFLIYADLLWPPQKRRLHNPDRFVLMFAPITRSYRQSFAQSLADADAQSMTAFRHNKLQMPKSVEANIAYLRAWQQQFDGDGFDFDYHNIWACYYDPNQYALAQVLHKDIQALEQLGLNGLNSCQNQRASFPHNLLMDVLAQALWNKRRSFASIARKSFADAYGSDSQEVAAFFRKMSRLWAPMFDPLFIPKPDGPRRKQALANLSRMRRLMNQMTPLVNLNLTRSKGAIRWSWKYLQMHLAMLERLLPAFEAYLHRAADCQAKFEQAFDWLWRQEKQLHPSLDMSTMIKVLRWRIHEARTSTTESTCEVG